MSSASPHSTLQDELKLINCLVDLMKQEQQFLIAANTDGLATLTPLKAQLVAQANALAARRHQCLADDNFPDSDVGMAAWLARMDNPAAASAWEQLLDRSREAKEQNRINGMLINKQLAQNQQLINAMRTPAGAADTAFYGPQGQATTPTGKRGLAVG